MRSMMWALLAILLVAAVPAFAAGEKGQLELGVYWGHAWLDDYGIFHPDNDNILGARLGYFFSDHWSLEASYQKIKTDTEMNLIGVPEEGFNIHSWRGNLLYNFGGPGSGVRPFLTFGLGHEKTDVNNFGESCDISWNAGGGLRFGLGSHWNIRADGRYVSVKVGDEVDESQKNTEATIGLSYLFGGHHEHVAEAAPPPEAPANQPPSVSCSPERAELLPGETVNVTASGSDPEGGPLTYDWSATGGRVSGTGPSATLEFTGATPPASATITVRVTDDHGLSATSDCTVRLIEPVKPAEAVSCTAGNFPRNLARLSNVDKACLDDVAQRLGSDPRAHVVVIGHADTKETSGTVGQRRAEAVRDYLVKERSVDGSRITVRSAGTSKPLGADAAGNRRVEIWFVPDGAKDPD